MNRKTPLWPQLLATFVACQITVLGGVIASMSSVILAQEDVNSTLGLTPTQRTWIVSVLPLSGIVGSLLGSWLQKQLGCRRLMLVVSLVQTAGWLGNLAVDSFALLLLLRTILGASVYSAMAAGQVYVVETASPELRGFLSGMPETSLKLGWILAVPLGRLLDSWRYAYCLSGLLPSLLLLVGCVLLPETPQWLLARGRRQDAVAALEFLRRDRHTAEAEAKQLETSLLASGGQPGFLLTLALVRQRHNLMPTLMVLGQFSLMALSGIWVVYGYAVVLLREVQTAFDEYYCTMLMMFLSLITNTASSVSMERIGRCRTLALSGVVMAPSMLGLAAFFWFRQYLNSVDWLPLPLLLIWMCGFAFGAPVIWTLLGELLPCAIRHVASNLIIVYYSLASFGLLTLYPTVRLMIGDSGVYTFFGICCLAQVFYATLVLPETSKVSLHSFHDDIRKKTTRKDNKTEESNASEKHDQRTV